MTKSIFSRMSFQNILCQVDCCDKDLYCMLQTGGGSTPEASSSEVPGDEDITPEGLAMWQHIAAASSRAASEPDRPAPTDAGADAAARIWAGIQLAATKAASEPDFPELSLPSSKPDQTPRKGDMHLFPSTLSPPFSIASAALSESKMLPRQTLKPGLAIGALMVWTRAPAACILGGQTLLHNHPAAFEPGSAQQASTSMHRCSWPASNIMHLVILLYLA